MVNDLSKFISMSSGKLHNGFVTFALASVLSACGGGGGEENTPSNLQTPVTVEEPETAIQGSAVKGVISNGVVRVYEIVSSNGVMTISNSPYRNAVRTDANGTYAIRFRGKVTDASFLVEITADSASRMTCDVLSGCLDANGNLTAFGSSFPLPNDFQLFGIVTGVNSGDTISANLTPMTHMALSYATRLPGGLTTANLNTSKRHIETMLQLDQNALDQSPVDISRLGSYNNVSKTQLEASVVSAAFLGLVNTPEWDDIADVLTRVSEQMEQSGSLVSASTMMAQEVSLEDLFYEANSIAEDLIAEGTADRFTSILGQVSNETLVSYQQVAESETPSVAPVSINAHPQSSTVSAGSSAAFSVVASGGGSLAFQWRKDGFNLVGRTESTLTIPSTSLNDQGLYDVVVTNSAGSVTSLQALLTVNQVVAPVAITTQPSAVTRTVGQTAQFAVVATGGGTLSYQWRRNGSNISGANAATLSLSNVQTSDAASYSVVVTNSVGSVTSSAATLTVNQLVAPVAISTQPTSLTRNEGQSASFSVVATGGGTLSYQWRRNGTNIPGATSSMYSIIGVQMSDAGSFTVVVSNSVGSVTSGTATLTVNQVIAPVVITTQPVSITRNEGQSAQFSVAVTGGGTLAYQWRRNGINISGANAATLALSNVQMSDAASYSVIVSNSVSSVSSSAAQLTVNPVVVPRTIELSWSIPDTREDDTYLAPEDIAGYVIAYGAQSGQRNTTVNVSGGLTVMALVPNLAPGTYYFAIATVDQNGTQGAFSSEISVSAN